MADIIQIRRGTAAAWTAANPTLASGEKGLETDSRKTKTGDGVTAWTSLAYDIIQMTGDVTISASGVTAIGNLKVLTAMINTNAVTYAKLQQGAAQTILVNNTSGAANFAETSFYDVPLATYGGTITWNGTAPTTIVSQQYAWSRIGNTVTLMLYVVYTNAGVTNTLVTFTLPSDCPTPATIAGRGANANEVMYMGVGQIEPSVTSAPGNNRSYISKNSANNGYIISVAAASASAKVAGFTIQYRTS